MPVAPVFAACSAALQKHQESGAERQANIASALPSLALGSA
jgi:hypothetical protein